MTNAALLTICLVASIVMGETSVAPSAGYVIAQMVVRDMDIGRDLSRWHGRQVPNAWAWACAERALLAGADADLPRHALSESDMGALGFDKANWTPYCGEDGRWCVYTGRVWR